MRVVQPVATSNLLLLAVAPAWGYQAGSAASRRPPSHSLNPFKAQGLDNLELPDLSELFEKIQQVSPLARSLIAASDEDSQGDADDGSPQAKGAPCMPCRIERIGPFLFFQDCFR